MNIKLNHANSNCFGCKHFSLEGCRSINLCVENSCYAKEEMVNHPKHYQSENGIEVIDVIEAFTSDLNGVEAFDTANIIKYACRWNSKNGVEDLKKVVWYANHLIERLENK